MDLVRPAVSQQKGSGQATPRGQLEKAKRAFAKAGQPDAGEEVRTKWLTEMSAANIAVMKFSSSRLAKVIKGDLTVADLEGEWN